MPAFNRIPGKFRYAGMDLHHPPDLMPEDRCPFLFNMQADILTGALAIRPPINSLATTAAGVPIHSISRLNDSIPGAAQPFTRFAGAGGGIYAGPGGALSQIDTGYSGNPVAFVPYRPAQSAEPWMYTYDSSKQRRFKTDNTTQQIGIASPTTEPALARVQPLYKIVENAQSTGNWSPGTTAGGTTTGPTLVNRVPAGGTNPIYDSGTTGMCSFGFTPSFLIGSPLTWMTAGSMITVDSEQMVIEQVFSPVSDTTIAQIAYDSGSTGLCTIVLAIPVAGVQRNMLLYFKGTTFFRVLSVTAGPNASYSIRLDSGATTLAIGDTVEGVASFRAWSTVHHAIGAAITGNAIQFTFTPTNPGGQMQDWVATNPTLPATIDLTNVGGQRPLQNEDYMHLSLAFDHPEFIQEVHITLITNPNQPTTADNSSYLYYVVRPGDFQASIAGLGNVSTQQATLQSQLDALSSQISGTGVTEGLGENVPQPPYPAPQVPSSSAPATQQLQLGGFAWTEVMFKLSDLTAVGSGPMNTLQNVQKLGIYVFVSGGPVIMNFGGWWVGGGYGPDCNFNTFGNQAPEIQWRYRYRNSSTGAHSTVSPETRNGEILRRQAVSLTAPNSPDSQVDLIDWERRGGTNPDWHYVGSVAQGVAFVDQVTEAAAQIGEPLEVTCYQPWPVTDTPKTGTALVTGTSVVWQSGPQFNVQWLRGTEVILGGPGGSTFSLYAPPSSTTKMQLAQNYPSPVTGSTLVAFSIPEATIESQPLYGAWLDEANNRVLGLGDPLNPGLLYFSNSDNPDGVSDAGYIEVSSPSEPLLNGFYAEGANYVFTSSSLYRVESTPGATNPYVAYRLSGVEGLAGPWAFDAQRRIVWYWGPDGIYGYSFGPSADNLTANDLFPLFPHEGQAGRQSIPGVPVTISGQTIFPPDYSQASKLRIGYSESFVYSTYQNSNAALEALVYSLGSKGWRKDAYLPQATVFWLEKGISNPQLLVGGADGNLYTVGPSSSQDAGGAIPWAVLTRAVDAGDSRAVKQFGDLMLDYSGTMNVQVLWDNLLVSGASGVVPPQSNRTHYLFDLFTPPDTNDTPLIHYNLALMLSGVGCNVYLYEWQPSYLPLPEITSSRPTDWQTGGALHYKYVQGIRLHANTFGSLKILQVQYDGYQNGPVIPVNMNGEQTIPISFQTPFKCHMMRLVPVDDTPWEVFPDSEWIFEPEPEPAAYWISQPTALGQNGFLHAREMWVPYAAPGSSVFSVIVDGGTPVTLATLSSSTSPSKQYVVLPPLKGKYWQWTASGTGLQIYENDLEVLVKSWGSTGPYQRVKPFGDVSGGAGRSGARI